MTSKMKKKRATTIPKTPYNTNNNSEEQHSCDDHLCSNPCCCFFCTMREPDRTLRRSRISTCFRELPHTENQEHVLVLSTLWHLAMTHPNDPEFPSLGIFNCMAKLIHKAIHNRKWLLTDQNIYIPYYAAHIIGSYTMNKEEFAQIAVQSGVIPPLLELLRGKISWVEQRVVVRALGHLASYKSTFESVAEHEPEVVKLALNLASTCLEVVYVEFFRNRTRPEYHRNLLTRGIGDLEMENRKSEEWASQLQSWSIYLLNCFASKQSSLALSLICKNVFLEELCEVWGGLVNHHTSPGGVGLLRILCYSKLGRKSISELPKVVESLCNLSRSSDDWQYKGIDCLVLLLKDRDTRYRVIDIAISYLIDLIELRNLGDKSNVGDTITKVLLLEHCKLTKHKSQKVEKLLQEVVDLKVGKRNKEKLMSEEELEEFRVLMSLKKHEGNHFFRLGKVEEALVRYTDALDVCPLRFRQERMKLYSNKAQCHLLLKNPDSAISDSTRALCLCHPPNTHSKSLWRRSQVYDMKGMARESLMDCVAFLSSWMIKNTTQSRRRVKIPYRAARMICKQMEATWLFANARSKVKQINNLVVEKKEGTNQIEEDENEGSYKKQILDHKMMMMEKRRLIPGLSTIIEEPFHGKEASRRKMERRRRRVKKVNVPRPA